MSKAAKFEQLYWDVFNYSMTGLRLDPPESIGLQLKSFAEAMTDTAVISKGSTATGS